jgi:hypothetical protein
MINAEINELKKNQSRDYTKYRESYDKPIFTKGEFQYVDLRTAICT